MKCDTIIWCSDLNSNTGEGVLAKKFLQKYSPKEEEIKIFKMVNLISRVLNTH